MGCEYLPSCSAGSILISHYISGLFNLFPKPPKKLFDMWDVNVVLDYWNRQPLNSELSLMMLSQKVVLLILISTMHRHTKLLCMSLQTVLYYLNCMVFPFDKYPKTYSLSHSVEELRYVTVHKFTENPQICPLLALQAYIRKTSVIRSMWKLFITTQSPYNKIANMTLRRWILTGLDDSGVDVNKYSAKTMRHVSSSKAYYAGVNVDQVMLHAGWTNVSSFVSHYNLPIMSSAKTICEQSRKNYMVMAAREKRMHNIQKQVFATHSWKKNAKNIRAQKLLINAQKQIEKCNILFHDAPYVALPPLVSHAQLKSPTKIIVLKSVTIKGKYVKVNREVVVLSWPADQVIPVVGQKLYKNPGDHDDSETE